MFIPHYFESLKILIKLADASNGKKFRSLFLLLDNIKDVDKCKKLLEKRYNCVHEENIVNNEKVSFLHKLFNGHKKYIKFLKNEKINTIIFPNDGNIFILKAAKKLGIKTIGIQWAHTASRKYFDELNVKQRKEYFMRKYSKRLVGVFEILFKIRHLSYRTIYRIFGYKLPMFFTDGMADYYCIMGRFYAEMFNKQGTPIEKLVVTGHPEHDYLFELKKKRSKKHIGETRLKFRLDPDKKLIVIGREAIRFFNLLPEEKDRKDINDVFNVIKGYSSDAEIVLKIHPRDDIEFYDFVKKKYKFVKIFHYDIDFYSLISCCDIYISQVSSTMNWSIALDIPTISYDFNGIENWKYIRNRKGLLYANTPDELNKLINKCIYLPDKKIFENMKVAQGAYMKLDGKAIERILSLADSNNKMMLI